MPVHKTTYTNKIGIMSLPTIGVLALQGAFREHIEVLSRLDVTALSVRTKEDLYKCDGLVIPGK
jgi:glutamine amidotransferase PdxT